MACNSANVRSEEHVRQKFSVCGIISETDRAKDVEQFDDILRTFTNEINKFENIFCKIRDEEKMLAVKKLMPESLQNYRFRGTTMSYSELTVALENIVDKVVTVPTARNKKHDTSASMEIGRQRRKMERMRAKKETKGSCTSLCRLSTEEVQRKVGRWQGSELEREGWQRWQRWRKKLLQEGQRQERRQRAREWWQGRIQNVLDVWQGRTLQLVAGKEDAIDEGDSENAEGRHGVYWK